MRVLATGGTLTGPPPVAALRAGTAIHIETDLYGHLGFAPPGGPAVPDLAHAVMQAQGGDPDAFRVLYRDIQPGCCGI